MNIFVCDLDPTAAAVALPDKLVVKMALETAQILCTVLADRGVQVPYRPTHRRHPAVLWCGSADGNVAWTVQHGLALCDEYARRYGRTHKSRSVIELAAALGLRGDTTPFAQCMPDEFKGPDPVQAYRSYLVARKSHFATYKSPAVRPHWWVEGMTL